MKTTITPDVMNAILSERIDAHYAEVWAAARNSENPNAAFPVQAEKEQAFVELCNESTLWDEGLTTEQFADEADTWLISNKLIA